MPEPTITPATGANITHVFIDTIPKVTRLLTLLSDSSAHINGLSEKEKLAFRDFAKMKNEEIEQIESLIKKIRANMDFTPELPLTIKTN